MNPYLFYYELDNEKIYMLVYGHNYLDAKNRLEKSLDMYKLTAGTPIFNATILENP